MTISRYNISTFKKIGKLSQKKRKKHLDNWDSKAYKDIKTICGKACASKKIPQKTLKRLKSQKKDIRKIASANPATVKKILVSQKGSGLFTAIAAGIIPAIVGAISAAKK